MNLRWNATYQHYTWNNFEWRLWNHKHYLQQLLSVVLWSITNTNTNWGLKSRSQYSRLEFQSLDEWNHIWVTNLSITLQAHHILSAIFNVRMIWYCSICSCIIIVHTSPSHSHLFFNNLLDLDNENPIDTKGGLKV